jgi:hypothetical protein
MNTKKPVLSFIFPSEFRETTTVKSYAVWSKTIAERTNGEIVYNEQAIQYLSDIPNFGGFVYGPAYYDGKLVETERHTISDITELKEKLKNSNGMVFISSLVYNPGIPYFYEMDDNQDIFPVEGGMKFTPFKWVVGYGILEN